MMTNRRMTRLLRRYLDGTASVDEVARVEKWWSAFPEGEALPGGAALEETREALFHRIRFVLDGGAPVRPLYQRPVARLTAAAVLVLIVGGYWLLSRTNKPTPNHALAVAADIGAPAKTRATLTLSGGRQILLDSAATGALAQQGRVTIQKTSNGRLQYVPASPVGGQGSEIVFYNTLTNPRGSQVISLFLPDGTQVWLNAASSLRYPVSFGGLKQREVSLTGEGYFDVAKNPAQPFNVSVNGDLEVGVLGTSFNINAYDDEKVIRTTLLEGSVMVKEEAGSGVVLKPREQARVIGGKMAVVSDVDVEQVMAWKNGEFEFNGADIAAILREISRWYDVQVVFAGAPPPGHFSGIVSRSGKLSDVLKIFGQANIHYTIDKNQLTILP
jgi:transmembrane sensor